MSAGLLGAARHAREVVGMSVWPWLQAITDAGTAAVRDAAGAADLSRLSAEGARLRAVDALAYGLAAVDVPKVDQQRQLAGHQRAAVP